MLTAEAPVHTLGRHLRRRYGRRLRRVMLDLGLSCPNRDGVSGRGGCIYCDVHGSGTGAAPSLDLAEQWRRGLARVRRSQPEGPAAIAYLQSYSNTWPDLGPLARAVEFLAGQAADAPILAVGTRPDCFSPAAAELLAGARNHFREVWLELGLETADDRVQEIIGRHDRLENFHRACALARRHGLGVVAHTIAGLPGDRPDGLLRQVEEAAAAGVTGIKFHQLMVLRRTRLEVMWRRGEVELLRPEEYIGRVADALERLPAAVVVHRLVAENPPERYLAPLGWPPRARVHAAIEAELRRRGAVQGCRAGRLE
ncbi:MAG: TIGR01212 family radical SAM protein [Planctomycetota bacterium]|nr:MAG: TIGR01212 family radical SAM protein [Planctomycetota bacterium]